MATERGQMVPVSSIADEMDRQEAQAALAAKHEARLKNIFPGARPRETQENEELKQHMTRVGDQAQRILCSLSFRAWALALAEEKRHVAEISCCAGVALVRRAGHSKATTRLLEEKMRLQRELQTLRCFHAWSCQRSSRGDAGENGAAYRTPSATHGARSEGASVRSLWSVEGRRSFHQLERKLDAGRDALDAAFGAWHGQRSLQRFWRAWAGKLVAKRRAQELYRGCLRINHSVNLRLSFKAWTTQLRRRQTIGALVRQRQHLERHGQQGPQAAFYAWRRRAKRQREVRSILLKQAVTDDENLQRFAWSAWGRCLASARRFCASARDRCAAKMLAQQDRGLTGFVFHGWWSSVLQRHGGHDSFHVAQRKLLHWRLAHEAARRGRDAPERRATALATQMLGASEALAEEQRKHFMAVQALMEWRRQVVELQDHAGTQRHIGRREMLLQRVAAAWGSDQARLHLQAVWRCWCICAHGNRVQELHRSFKDDLHRLTKAWGRGDLLFLNDLEVVRLHAIFLHWHRSLLSARSEEQMANLQERLQQVSMARLALAEGLQGVQGAQLSNLFLQTLLMNWHKSCSAQKEERRLLKRRQLAASLVDGSSRLGQQMLLNQTLFAWSGLAHNSKVADWAKRTAHAQSAKAVLAARIAFGATTGNLSDFVQRWHTAARAARHARAKEAARVALETSLKRRNLRCSWDRWVEAWRLDSTERMLQTQKEEATRQERQLKAGAARRLLQDQTGFFTKFVLHCWCTAARLDVSTKRRLVLNAWHETTVMAQQVRQQKACAREGSRRLATGLLRFLDGSLTPAAELLLRSAWQSWLCVATSGQAMGQAMQHDSLQRCAEAELRRLCLNLRGGQRRLAMGLCHENVLRLQLVFETWRRVRTKARARDLIGGLLNQESDLCLRLSLYRWRAFRHLRRRRKEALSKMVYYISQDETCHQRVLWNSWRLLLQDTKAHGARVQKRRGRCNTMQRMVHHFDSTLLMSTVFAWHCAVKVAALRKRFVKGSHSFCETVDGLCQAAQLQAIFTAWVDVLLISQTAAMRLGIRAPKEAMLGFYGAHLSKRSAVPEAQLKSQLAEAARGQAMLAPVRLQHLTIQAVFSHWQSIFQQLQEARQMQLLLLERCDLAILRACYSGWRDVYGRNPGHQQRLRQHQWSLRQRSCFGRVLARYISNHDVQEMQLQLLLLQWWRQTAELPGARMGSVEHLAYLQEVSVMLWTQDRRRELISHSITAWCCAVAQVRAESSRRAADSRRLALLTSCDALTRDEPQRLTAVLALRALLAWNRLLEVGTRRCAARKVKRSMCDVLGVGARREATTLMSNALAAWRREVQQVRGGRWLWGRRDHCLQLSDLLETRDRLSFFLRDWFLRWRCTFWESRAETFASELHLLASLLQESTITCRELRTQLLTLRGSSCRLGRAALCAVLVAWQRVVTQRIQDMGGRPAPPAPAPVPSPAATAAPSAPEPRVPQRTSSQQGPGRVAPRTGGPRETVAAQRVARLLSITSVKATSRAVRHG